MSGKVIAIFVVIIILIGGIYWYMQSGQSGAPQAAETPAETPAPQVAGQDATVGDGAEAIAGSQVDVLYVGMLPDGTIFDSSANNNNEPLSFVLGTPGIIPGFQIGVRGMKEGGERRIQIPPELGYGAQEIKDKDGKVIIPANTTLTFDIKLVKVTQPTATSTETTTE